MRLLIANRGEIARRIIRTAHRLGHETVAVFADPDRDAPHVHEATSAVRIGPADLASSYLSIPALLEAAEQSGATAVHPGYGFLAENATFARAVIDAGLTWVGPSPAAIDGMGSKIEARRLAATAGVPIIPGFDESQDPSDLATAAESIGFPVLIKASAGGGGRGIRIVHEPAGFSAALDEASSEAELAFGDRRVIVERYITRPRHVEVQVVGDKHGRVVHLGTRECSVQRRYQKLLEEAPAPNLPAATVEGLCSSAVELAEAIGYDSAGTVEYVVDDNTGDYFFLEMNTRLQVEHPVTEEVTGFDLVELQLRAAEGEALDFTQDDVVVRGHAFEARITSEDASAGFRPGTGLVRRIVVPDGVRWESAVVDGSEITPHYDPMIAKLVVTGPDRPTALRKLGRALDNLLLAGPTNTIPFHRWLIEQQPVVEGRVTTRFLDETDIPDASAHTTETARALAALAWHVSDHTGSNGSGPWSSLSAFRVTPHRTAAIVALMDAAGDTHEIEVDRDTASSSRMQSSLLRTAGGSGTLIEVPVDVDREAARVAVVCGAQTFDFRVVDREERWSASAESTHAVGGAIVAPFPATVAEIHAEPGHEVVAGDLLLVLEAMKMLHPLNSSGHGTVAEVRVKTGDQVEAGTVLVTFEPGAQAPPES